MARFFNSKDERAEMTAAVVQAMVAQPLAATLLQLGKMAALRPSAPISQATQTITFCLEQVYQTSHLAPQQTAESSTPDVDEATMPRFSK